MKDYIPPFTLTERVLKKLTEISNILDSIENYKFINKPKMNKDLKVRSIHSSLAIEANTLSLNEVKTIIDGHLIAGDKREITEVKNFSRAYDMMKNIDPLKVENLLKIHEIMMKDLIKDAGNFRVKGVGVFDGDLPIHIAPDGKMVPQLIRDLFLWYFESELPVLIKSSIFHYEFEFIHPFSDGNGRMGRFWHTILLGSWNEIFYSLPLEEVIRKRQNEYYESIAISNSKANSEEFVYMILSSIEQSLKIRQKEENSFLYDENINLILKILEDGPKSAVEIMKMAGLKHMPTFRKNYLNRALEKGVVKMTIPDKKNSPNQKYKKA